MTWGWRWYFLNGKVVRNERVVGDYSPEQVANIIVREHIQHGPALFRIWFYRGQIRIENDRGVWAFVRKENP